MRSVRFIFLVFVCFFGGSVVAGDIEPRQKNETDFLLIRHGETDWNKEKRTQGQSDNPLNACGLEQAEKLAEKIFNYHPDISNTLYSSDLTRAITTAKKTAERFQANCREMVIVQKKGLREYNFGEAEGMLVTERDKKYHEKDHQLKERFPNRKERWNYTLIPDSESLNALVNRAHEAFAEIAQAHKGEKVAIFAHGREINTLIIDSENLSIEPHEFPPLPNCAIVHFRYTPGNNPPLKFVKVEDVLQEAKH